MELHGKVASRYAKAILEWAGSSDKAKAIAKELKEFGSLISENPDLRSVLTTSVFAHSQRKAVLDDLFAKLQISKEAQRIIYVISDMKRLKALSAISFKLSELLLLKDDIVPVDVASSHMLSADEKKSIEGRFSKILGNPVEATYLVDPKLVGGVKVTAAGKTYDGTISGWLGRFEEILVGGNV